MELIYAWIEKFRNYKEVELSFSDKFIVKYDDLNKSIQITPNKSYSSIYPEYITNINAIVGKNGVGKTNLLDALGLKIDDRNKNDAEFEVRYKNKKRNFGYLIPDDIEAEIKHSIYFFIYYIGKDDNNQDLFCFEGNDIESFKVLIKYNSRLDENYWKSKYWFAFICSYEDNILIHKCDLNERLGDYWTEVHSDGIRYYGDSRSERDKLVIMSLRENYNPKYYDYRSTEPRDDYKISVPRRNAEFQSKFLEKKIDMLLNQLQNSKRHMFQDDKYTLKISYNSFFLTDDTDEENKLVLSHSFKDLNGRDKDVCKILESFVFYYYRSLLKINKEGKLASSTKEISEIKANRTSIRSYKDYYVKIVKYITDCHFVDKFDKEYAQYIGKCFKTLASELLRNRSISFEKDFIRIEISNKSKIDDIKKIISITADEKVSSNINETNSAFNRFFDYYIEDLSDGEDAYLGLYASLYEQISMLTPYKEKYIILLDEPEERMHPELTRNFVNELILFLRDLSEGNKKFQVIISTHSPFILSDIQPSNTIYLEKDNAGYCKPTIRKINTFGANIHTLLKDGFFMKSTMGEYAINKVKDVISAIDESNIEETSEQQKNEWLYIINSIGEPLIKNRIMKMFNDKFMLNYTDLYNENLKLKGKIKKYEEPGQISKTIEVLKKQIESLQIYINDLEAKHNDKD